MGVKISLNMMGDVERRMDKIPTVGVGMLGYAFMGKAHSNAYKKMPYIFWPPPAIPKLIAICGRDRLRVSGAAERYGYTRYYTDWRDLVKDPEVEIFDNGAPNRLHAEPCIAAAERGKHVICEKPMAATLKDARRMCEVARETERMLMIHHQLRWLPTYHHARKLIERGEIGELQSVEFDMSVFSNVCLVGYRSKLPHLMLKDL
ncbi:MAG: Gfo/Idh/MocA family oxidoreductase, partial [Candidatus Bathyarchaeia archaeon]